VARAARTFGAWSVIGLVLGTLLAAAAPLAIGGHSYTVRSGSMTPAIRTGDIVVAESIAPLRAQVGSIVMFRDPRGRDRVLTHRVRAMHRTGRRVDFITQGDANTARERWTVPVDGRIGRVLYRLPKLGYVLFWTGSPAARIALTFVPAVLLCLLILGRLWPSGRTKARRHELAT
jgi:signal peptidase